MIVDKIAWDDVGELRWRTKDLLDTWGRFTGPVGSRYEVEAGEGAVHGAELGEGVGALVTHLKHPKMIRHVGDLDDDRFSGEVEDGESVDDIGVRAGDAMEASRNGFAEHTEVVDGSDGYTSADAWSADEPHGVANVVEVDHRPTPDVCLFDG